MSWTCPNCDRELPWKDYRHYCQRVDLDSLFVGRSAELVLAFDRILAEVADWPDVLIGVTPNCIVFTRRLGFLIIRPMKKELDSSSILRWPIRKSRWSKVLLWERSLRTISGLPVRMRYAQDCLCISGNPITCSFSALFTDLRISLVAHFLE